MRIMSKVNPVGGVTDFWHEFTRPNPYRWPILAASCLMTFSLMYYFTQERVRIPPEPPQVTYITSFEAGRTDAQIAAANLENQRRQDELQAEREAREERVKDLYRSLGRASGMDVDAIEREAAEERAREQAAQRQERERLLGRAADDSRTR